MGTTIPTSQGCWENASSQAWDDSVHNRWWLWAHLTDEETQAQREGLLCPNWHVNLISWRVMQELSLPLASWSLLVHVWAFQDAQETEWAATERCALCNGQFSILAAPFTGDRALRALEPGQPSSNSQPCCIRAGELGQVSSPLCLSFFSKIENTVCRWTRNNTEGV